ncbi:hypothetical protein [Bradyrhizobium sp. SZCCHNS2096]|uniref:hypothetical protein n=1 Tax=Bradyrhizobium sp. SZCCHNS2096 TaxID=3057309 RepID=UPI002916DF3B|nr:hypothetical protein [Bradyrhizobium sp. SZCCHNS2096]
MAKSPNKSDDLEQSKRFIEAAKEAGSDETEVGADRAFKKVTSSKPAEGHSHPSEKPDSA